MKILKKPQFKSSQLKSLHQNKNLSHNTLIGACKSFLGQVCFQYLQISIYVTDTFQVLK